MVNKKLQKALEVNTTSKKMELKLTQTPRANLEELRLDYEDFLRQKKLPVLAPQDPVLMRFKNLKYNSGDGGNLDIYKLNFFLSSVPPIGTISGLYAPEHKLSMDNHGRIDRPDLMTNIHWRCQSMQVRVNH